MNSSARPQDTGPWPTESGQQPILFVLDASNRLEERLLREWLQRHADDRSPGTAEILSLSIGNGNEEINTRPLESALTGPEQTLVLPLRVVWLPSREFLDSGPRLRHLLLGDPRRPSAKQGERILKQDPQRACCIAAAPATIGALKERFRRRLQKEPDSGKELNDFVARQGGLALEIAERRLQGGRYKVPHFVAQSLTANPDYRAALEKLAATEQKPAAQLWKEARIYMKEMISISQRFYLDVNARFNSYVLGQGYEDKFVYNQDDVEKMREWVRNYPSMLLWTHKTYLDGMVVPKLLYDNDFPMPHIFGGANMSFAGLGFLLRRSGGIFIRRSFQDNELYKLTLKHYIGYLMEKRFPMHWAFEGTRSRLGKLMPPRYGLLKYVLEACYATGNENIHIIPVSISYDLLRDAEEYAREQTGKVKKAESLSWFIGYIRSLSRPMGRVYVEIGSPVVLERAPEPDDRLALSKIAFQVAVEVNRITPITLPSLVSMSLLGTSPQALTTAELATEVQALLAWAIERDIRISDDFDSDHGKHMRDLLEIMLGEGFISRYDEGPDVVFGIAPDQHPLTSYYRNTVIHFFVNKAIIELAIIRLNETAPEDPLQQFWDEVDRLRDLFKFEFFYSPTEMFHAEIRTELERCLPDWESLIGGGTATFIQVVEGLAPLVAHTTLLIYVEAYRIVADLLARLPADQGLDEKNCVSQALKYGRQALLQRRISSEASIGKLLFQNGYKVFQHQGMTEAGGSEVVEARRDAARQLRELALRLNRIKGIAAAQRGTQLKLQATERDVSDET
jgi:glycerol-3-phosphate O-acyltransferase